MAVKVAVLAAGLGTRMKSDQPKVLYEVAGRTMLDWVLLATAGAQPTQTVVVTAPDRHEVRDSLPAGVETCVQHEQLGTGHAARIALENLTVDDDDIVVIVPSDTPLLTAETMQELVDVHRRSRSVVTLLTTVLDDATGYGRIIRDSTDRVVGVVEHRDASPDQLAIQEINGGVYAFNGPLLVESLQRLGRDNVQGEYYLPDVVGMLSEKGMSLSALRTSQEELAGVNSHDQLAAVGGAMRRRINGWWMAEGVWMADPDTVHIGADVELAAGVRLYPGVHLEGTSSVEAGASVGPDTYVLDSHIGAGARVWYAVLRQAEVGTEAEVGPYVSLRPGARLGPRTKAGTFVEMKNTTVGEGSKVPHLTYLGDADIGRSVNVGAGTITCNYDGWDKFRTIVKDGAFIGSDTMLIAPVTIGEKGYTAAGSVISQDVADGALAVERSVQKEIPGYAARREARKRKMAEES